MNGILKWSNDVEISFKELKFQLKAEFAFKIKLIPDTCSNVDIWEQAMSVWFERLLVQDPSENVQGLANLYSNVFSKHKERKAKLTWEKCQSIRHHLS